MVRSFFIRRVLFRPECDTIMAQRANIDNNLRVFRSRAGWSQAEMGRLAGLSRAEISAIETGRLVPSTAVALALAGALGCTVEAIFRLPNGEPQQTGESWAWPRPAASGRFWRVEVGGCARLYPVEVSPLGLLPHDGTFRDEAVHFHPGDDSSRTLVLASCDPAVSLLYSELARTAGLRLIVLPRSSRAALDLLRQGLVHAAGVHLARSDRASGNGNAVASDLAPAGESEYNLLCVADWEEGIALDPSLGLRSVRAAVAANLRWVGREAGSAARDCLDELLVGSKIGLRGPGALHEAHSHRGVADAIRGSWAQAGVCLRLASDEANLSFLSVRRERYEICFPESMAEDPRLVALSSAVRSSRYRRLLGELPGYDVSHTGELNRIAVRRK
jgi:molybdate-binding protein/DNA-binding XRE family transcriptional regulator